MTEETVEDGAPKLTAAEKVAKTTLDNAVLDLGKAAAGTTVVAVLSSQLLVMQVDVLVDLLAERGAFDRVEFFQRITARVEALASECRRAVLAHGGASALAGIKPRDRN